MPEGVKVNKFNSFLKIKGKQGKDHCLAFIRSMALLES